jgi:hypothetical protein
MPTGKPVFDLPFVELTRPARLPLIPIGDHQSVKRYRCGSSAGTDGLPANVTEPHTDRAAGAGHRPTSRCHRHRRVHQRRRDLGGGRDSNGRRQWRLLRRQRRAGTAATPYRSPPAGHCRHCQPRHHVGTVMRRARHLDGLRTVGQITFLLPALIKAGRRKEGSEFERRHGGWFAER